MTGRNMHSYARDVPGIDRPDDPSVRESFLVEPSADLLDRAHVGWERFLDSCSEATDG